MTKVTDERLKNILDKGLKMMVVNVKDILNTYKVNIEPYKNETYEVKKKQFNKSMLACNSDINNLSYSNVYITTVQDKKHKNHYSQFYVGNNGEDFIVIEFKCYNMANKPFIYEVKVLSNIKGNKEKYILDDITYTLKKEKFERLPNGYKNLLEDALKQSY